MCSIFLCDFFGFLIIVNGMLEIRKLSPFQGSLIPFGINPGAPPYDRINHFIQSPEGAQAKNTIFLLFPSLFDVPSVW
jgi:hypothetical protein